MYKTPPYAMYTAGSIIGSMYGVDEATGFTFWVVHALLLSGITVLLYIYERSRT